VPLFIHKSFSLSILENEPPGSDVGSVTAEDKDSPPNNQFTYVLLRQTSGLQGSELGGDQRGSGPPFEIDRETGRIRTTGPLDRETQSLYTLTVGVRTVHSDVYTDTCTVRVSVGDVNDHTPVFTYPLLGNETLIVSSHTPRGHVVARLRAVDLDTGQNANLSYHVVMSTSNRVNLFGVVSETGAIVVKGDLSLIEHETFVLR